jgi:hypothetical protein
MADFGAEDFAARLTRYVAKRLRLGLSILRARNAREAREKEDE